MRFLPHSETAFHYPSECKVKFSFKNCRPCAQLTFQPPAHNFLLQNGASTSWLTCQALNTSVYFPEQGFFRTLYLDYLLFPFPILQNFNSSKIYFHILGGLIGNLSPLDLIIQLVSSSLDSYCMHPSVEGSPKYYHQDKDFC